MRLRLFWKILFLFWLTFMVIVEGMWVVYALYGGNHKPLDVEVAERFSHQQIATAQAVLQRDGIDSLRAVMAAWPAEEQGWLTVSPAGQAPAVAPNKPRDRYALPPLEVTATAPDGTTYRLSYDPSGLQARYRPPGPLSIPLPLVIFGMVGGLLFAAVLAWYLTKPIRRLRDGFAELAQGRLGVRLKKHMGRRRDELADLARDFDSMAERLQQLIASRERMLHVVSHELRSPLARIHLAVGLARQDPLRVESTLKRIELESKRLDKMVGEVLTLARAESGSQQLDDYFDLASLALTVANDARFEAQSSGVMVETNLGKEPSQEHPTVKGNAELLRRALENVVRNAMRHSATGQTVRIEVSPQWSDKHFVIKVSDEGPGMEPKALETFFEPFVQGHGLVDGQGFGLGLAIAQKAVQAHGGSIKAQNRPSRGLIVTIRLPFGPAGAT
ncbi:MAG: HAMP domain-containing histidine kinase [Proteobacteria bacterium]|nr:HAMP domain-containing histidine kinase [Pseudomonadota bacterium]MBU4382641.1 HAMP domain-containing histidine kinase [Pseudomonadota bacterium]MBU4606755.1 HAMP domain-containing histidine kinase [Pseudomonadota bacterium]MCG2765155.1 HAMP domain-containing histidine kinase [Desulfarculaceae bacterium]